MTLAEILSQMRVHLQDASDEATDAATKTTYANLAQRDIAKAIGGVRGMASVLTYSGTNQYQIENLLELGGFIQHGDEQLCPITLERAFDLYGENWATETGEPLYYVFGPWGPEIFQVVPDPGSNIASDLKVLATTLPATMTGSATPDIPLELHDALVWRACYHVACLDSEQVSPAKAELFNQRFAEQMASYLGRLNRNHDTSPTWIHTPWL